MSKAKFCNACGATKPIDEFYRQKGKKDGRQSKCKPCKLADNARWKKKNREVYLEQQSEYMRKRRLEDPEKYRAISRQWREANPEQARAAQRKWREENREYNRERRRKWYEENRDKELEGYRQWAKRNQEHLNAYKRHRWQENLDEESARHRRWREENPEKARERNQRYRARKLSADGNFSADEWLALCADYEHVCLCCGKAGDLTADHVVPLSKGGANDISNIQPLCLSCNSRKRTRSVDYRTQWGNVG